MKHKLLYTLGPIVLIMVAFATSPAQVLQQPLQVAPAPMAVPTAPGPYYAPPSWDLQLPAYDRFIILSDWGNAAVLDKETGLVWEGSPSTTAVSWANASSRCLTLAVSNRKGWRLPTIQELASLVDMSVPSSLKLPAGHPFSKVQSSYYWSATTYARNTSDAWFVHFFDGLVGSVGKARFLFVWCVRGGQGVDPQ